MEASNYHRAFEKRTDEKRKATMYSFNTWAIPFGNPNALNQPFKCSKEIGEEVRFMLKHDIDHENEEHLLVVCLQEVWTWKAGLGRPVTALARLIERHVSGMTGRVIVNILLGLSVALSKIFPFPIYYTKATDPYCKELLEHLPFVKGLGGCKDSCTIRYDRLVNSGLLTFSNKPILNCGFTGYINCTDSGALANKGFLWTVHDNNGKKVLIINTHTQGSCSSICNLHIAQLEFFLDDFLEKNSDIQDVYIMGDINLEPPDLIRMRWNEKLRVKKLTDNEDTLNHNNPDRKSLDHVFYRGQHIDNFISEEEGEQQQQQQQQQQLGDNSSEQLIYKSRVLVSQSSDHNIRSLIINQKKDNININNLNDINNNNNVNCKDQITNRRKS